MSKPTDLRSLVEDRGSIHEAITIGRFLNDPKLERYERHQLKDYVTFCCGRGFLIEAYAVVLQYVEGVVIGLFKGEQESDFIKDSSYAPVALETLWRARIVTDAFYNLFKEVNKKRNQLVHKILDNPGLAEKFAGKENQAKNLLDLIDLAENFVLTFVKNNRSTFKHLFTTSDKNLTKALKKKQVFIVEVITHRASEEAIIEGGPDLDEVKKQLMDSFRLKFEDVLGLSMERS